MMWFIFNNFFPDINSQIERKQHRFNVDKNTTMIIKSQTLIIGLSLVASATPFFVDLPNAFHSLFPRAVNQRGPDGCGNNEQCTSTIGMQHIDPWGNKFPVRNLRSVEFPSVGNNFSTSEHTPAIIIATNSSGGDSVSGRTGFNITVKFDLCPGVSESERPGCIDVDPEVNQFWVGMYLENEDVERVVPFKYQWLENVPGFSVNGKGQLTFTCVNMRKNFVAKIFAQGIDNGLFLGQSNVIEVVDKDFPTQRRVSYFQDENSKSKDTNLVIAWTAGKDADQELVYRVENTDQWKTIDADRDYYSSGDLCAPPATTSGWREHGATYYAKLPVFDENTKIYYSVGPSNICEQNGPCETTHTDIAVVFQPPKISDKIRAYVYGDLGSCVMDESFQDFDVASFATIQNIVKFQNEHDPDFETPTMLFHDGDLSYAMGYAQLWDLFFDLIEPLSSRMAYFVTVGNHERDSPKSGSAYGETDSQGECGVPTLRRFRMPWHSGPDSKPPTDEPWYSFDFGPVHFAALSSEHHLLGAQYEWLKSDLENVDRKKTPWVVVGSHRPYYISSHWHGADSPSADYPYAHHFQEIYEDMFIENGVDVVLGAHHHSYQRSCPVYKNSCCDSSIAPVFVCIGMAGASNSAIDDEQHPIWQFLDDRHHGYTVVDADEETFTMRYFRGPLWDEVADSFVLTKSGHGNMIVDGVELDGDCRRAFELSRGNLTVSEL